MTGIHVGFRAILTAFGAIVIAVVANHGAARADIITWDFTGTLTKVTDGSDVLAAANPSLAVGSPFNLIFSFDYTLAPTFPNLLGPSGGVTSWWGAGHSTMQLTVGSLFWQTVGPERVDAVYDNPPPAWGGPVQQIDSDHWNGSINTNVSPGFVVTSGDYHLAWVLANGATLVLDPSAGADYLVWTLGPTSFNEPTLTPDNFPTSINLSNWETSGMFLDVSLTGNDGATASYYIEGTFTDAATVSEPASLWLFVPSLLLLGALHTFRRCSGGVTFVRSRQH